MKGVGIKNRRFSRQWLVMRACLCIFSTAGVHAAPDLTLGVINGSAGNSVSVPVSFVSNGNIVGMQFDVVYDDSQLSADVPVASSELTASGHGVASSHITTNTLRVVITPPADNVAINTASNSNIIQLPFTVSSTAASGGKILMLSNVILRKSNANLSGIGKLINGVITDDLSGDTDGDGMNDGWEYSNGLDATSVVDAFIDSDLDGLTNLQEYLVNTNPLIQDNTGDYDGDGIFGALDEFPLDATEFLDTDDDGIGNNSDLDDDNDGMSDAWEVQYGLDPLDSADALQDLDGDSVDNLTEYQQGTNPADAYEHVVLADNPLSYWRFEESSGISVIDIAELNGGTYSGVPELTVTGIAGTATNTAVQLDGVDDEISIDFGYNTGSVHAIEAWVYPDSTLTTQQLFSLMLPGATYDKSGVQFIGSSQKLRYFTFSGSQYIYVESLNGLAINAWNHVYLERDGNSVTITINGVSSGGNLSSPRVFSGTRLYMGRGEDASGQSTERFSGQLDEVAFYTHALTSSRVTTHYQVGIGDADGDGMSDAWEYANGLNPSDASDAVLDEDIDGLTNFQEFQSNTNPTNWDSDSDGMSDGWEGQYGLNPLDSADAIQDLDGDGLSNLDEYHQGTSPTDITISDNYGQAVLSGSPVTYWRLNESVGTQVVDYSGNGYDGSYINNPALGATGLLASTSNSAVLLSNSSYIDLPLTAVQTGSRTVEVLAFRDVMSSNEEVIYFSGDQLGAQAFLISLDSTGIRFNCWGSANDDHVSYEYAGKILHLVMSYDGTTKKAYINGQEVVSREISLNTASTMHTVGRRGDDSRYYNGTVDEVAIYNYALSASVINTHYAYAIDDVDSDEMKDSWETVNGLDPSDASDAVLDGDGDGLTNMQEFENNTDPSNWDSDSDGMADGWEVQYGLNPLDSNDATQDMNGDGVDNLTEYQQGTDPTLVLYSQVVFEDSPLSFWRFEEQSGASAIDSTGLNHGTYSGAPGLTVIGIAGAAPDTAVQFDGVDDDVSANIAYYTGNIHAFEAWVYPENSSVTQQLISYMVPGATYDKSGVQFVGSSQKLRYFTFSGSQYIYVESSDGLAINAWNHVYIERDGSSVTIIINGVSSGGNLSSPRVFTGTHLYMGRGEDASGQITERFSGRLDEAAFYAHALTAGQVITHYQAGSGN